MFLRLTCWEGWLGGGGDITDCVLDGIKCGLWCEEKFVWNTWSGWLCMLSSWGSVRTPGEGQEASQWRGKQPNQSNWWGRNSIGGGPLGIMSQGGSRCQSMCAGDRPAWASSLELEQEGCVCAMHRPAQVSTCRGGAGVCVCWGQASPC